MAATFRTEDLNTFAASVTRLYLPINSRIDLFRGDTDRDAANNETETNFNKG